MKKVFITHRLPEVARTLLEPHFEVRSNPENKALSEAELKDVATTNDVILATVLNKLTKDVLAEAGRLEVISNYAAGLDNIDLEYAEEKGIAVYNTPGIVTNSTADLTMALFLTLARRVPEATSFVKSGEWKCWDPEILLGDELEGKRFGIIGMGQIGQAVAKRAQGFGMEVIYYNRSNLDIQGAEAVSLDALLGESDYISIHVPLTDETRGMINKETIKKMRKKPVLLNLARGGVVNTDDLVEALKSGDIRAAGLDVTDPEPIPKDHELCRMENCIVVPHIGTATTECRHKMAEMAARNILKHYNLL